MEINLGHPTPPWKFNRRQLDESWILKVKVQEICFIMLSTDVNFQII